MPAAPDLHSRRLHLRAPREGDLDAMHATFSDPRAMRYWSSLPDPDRETTRQRLLRQGEAFAAGQPYYALDLDGAWVGCAGNHQEDEIGFMLAPAHWGKGLVVEAMEVLIPHLWRVTDHARLTADVDPRNRGSLRVLEKLGFRETHRAARTFCIGGEWSDSVYFALDRPPGP